MTVAKPHLLRALQTAYMAARDFPEHSLKLWELLERVRALPAQPTPLPNPQPHPRVKQAVHAPSLVIQEIPQARQRVEVSEDRLGDQMREAEGARALLLEIIRRAAFDWVLYRSSTRLEQKALAADAYQWIFQEDEDHFVWPMRREEGKLLTAFVTICEELDLDVERVRGYIRNLTPSRVMSSGRPPENSRSSEGGISVEVHTRIPEISGGEDGFDFDALIGQLLDS